MRTHDENRDGSEQGQSEQGLEASSVCCAGSAMSAEDVAAWEDFLKDCPPEVKQDFQEDAKRRLRTFLRGRRGGGEHSQNATTHSNRVLFA